MRLRWMCRCTTVGGRIIRLTYGNIAGRVGAWYSTSSWGAGATGLRNSWRVSTEYCRPTAMPLTTRWAGRNWCMPRVGAIIPTLTLSRAVTKTHCLRPVDACPAQWTLQIISQGLEEGEQLRRGLPLAGNSWSQAGPLPERVEHLPLHLQVSADVAAGCAD